MRVSTEVSVSLDGDISLAQKYVSRARTILGMMKASNNKDLEVQNWRRTLPDGTLIEVSSIHGRDYIRIYALVEEDLLVEEYLYVKHFDLSQGFKIWRYDRNGNPPVEIQNLASEARTHFGMRAPKAGTPPVSYIHYGYDVDSLVVKNTSTFITPPLTNGLAIEEIATNSSQLVILDGLENYHFYNLDGTLDHILPTINVAQGETHLTINDKLMLVPDDGFRYSLIDYDGNILNTVNDATDRQSCNRDVFIVDITDNTIRVAILNNLGVRIADHIIPVSYHRSLSQVGITTDRIYVIYLGNTTGTNRVDIYEHILTFTDGIATAAVLGPLLYSVPAPTTQGLYYETWQNTAIDSSLFKANVKYKFLDPTP